jgi:serine/threonine protein kinase
MIFILADTYLANVAFSTASSTEQKHNLSLLQLLAQLNHPNIIAYKESFVDSSDGALCIVTSFCDEGDLFNRIKKQQQSGGQLFGEDDVMDIFVQVGVWVCLFWLSRRGPGLS